MLEKRTLNNGKIFVRDLTPLKISYMRIGKYCEHLGNSSGYIPLALYIERETNVLFAVSMCSSQPQVFAAFTEAEIELRRRQLDYI